MNSFSKSRWSLGAVIMVLVIFLITTFSFVGVTAQANEAVPPPDKAGPYKVGWYLTHYIDPDYGRYNAIIYYPAQRDGWRAKKDTSESPYPGIVVSNGYYGSNWNITWVSKHLASHGYIVIAFTPPEGGTLNTWTLKGLIQSTDQTQWAQGFNLGIDKMKQQNSGWFSPICNLLDINEFGVIALSMGGAGAIEAAASNPEIDTVVGLAPSYLEGIPGMDNCDVPDWMMENLKCVMADLVNATDNVTVPIQLQVGTNDGFIKYEWIYKLYNDLLINTSVKAYVEINGGSHAAYLDLWVAPIGDLIEQILGNANVCGFEEQHQVASRYFTSWFQYYLKGISEYETYIFGASAQNDLDTGILTRLEHE